MKKKEHTLSEEKIKAAILKILKEHPYQSFNDKQIDKKLLQRPRSEVGAYSRAELATSVRRAFVNRLMQELVQQGAAIEKDHGRIMDVPVPAYAEGIIDFVASGAAYVLDENFEDDIYIPPAYVKNALHGDRVKVFVHARRKNQRLEGEVVEILQRARTDFAGTLQLSSRFAFLIPDSNKMHTDIFIPLKNLNGAKDGDRAVARITEWSVDSRNPVGEIVRVLGRPGENDAEMNAIVVENGFPLAFSAETEKEAELIPYRIPKSEIRRRRDCRFIPTFTIDPADARDFDDALSFRPLDSNCFEVGVHIADVTYYVREHSAIDKEAAQRATSVYLVDRVIPMLPEKLSNHVCSLRPHEDKLCFSVIFHLDIHGHVLDRWIGRTIIHSDRRFTYDEAQQQIETGRGDFAQELIILNTIAQNLRMERFRKGAISFEKSEIKFHLDEWGFPTGVYLKEYKDANRLIEEFMLLANRTVAEYTIHYSRLAGQGKKAWPFVFRIHDSPPSDKIEEFARFAARFGYKIRTGSDREIAHSLNELMKEIRGRKEQHVLEQLAIRAMAKARYSTENIGHYGLAFDHYTHFTSPIRRYPDMMVHRLLTAYLQNGKVPDEEELERKCQHCSEMEIRAAEAERASVRFKQVQYLQGHEGEIFDAIISGVTEWGLFVELTESKCEGLIRLRDLGDDFYEYDEKNYCLRGYRTRKIFQLGDSLKVILKSTDLENKQLDFTLADETIYSSPARKKRKGGRKD
jgi:ribonuclease R